MQIKDIRQFRTWFKNLQKSRQNEWCDENFMGSTYKDFTGFLGMYHGDKDDIYGFLRKEVEMAEDGQAIYEFVQNAADSNSSHFYLFYDENYFLSVNNGDVFTKEGIKSILNIGQSFGKTETDQIGRYGIGFKLVHRLVGRTQGLDELLNKDGLGYRGPQMFSWDKKSDLRSFIDGDELQYNDFQNESSWLLKILITNFPALPDETVLDTNHNSYIPYPSSELDEFRTFLVKCSDFIDINVMDHGSIFFLKLGEGKYEHLLKQENEYVNGLETSMHFLKSLKFIGINDKEIEKDENANNSHRFLIKNGSNEFNAIGLTEERDKKSDIIFHICYANNEERAERIKQKPNIYKYFPAVKEVNNLAMIIHSNVFELTSNRQNLTETPTNKRLLPLLADSICGYMDDLRDDNPEEYRNLFLSILLSDAPNTNSGNGWQSEYFYDILLEYSKKNVPTSEMEYTSSVDVIIKDTSLQLNPSEFGLAKQWFYWEEIEENTRLIEEAYSGKKLDLYQYSIKNLIEEGNIRLINAWISALKQETYEVLLNEINEKLPKKNFNELEFVLCSDEQYYSVNELISNHDIIMLFNQIEDISNILIQLGFIVSTIKLDNYSNICNELSKHIDYLKVENNYKLFDSYIKPKTVENELSPQQKKDLFLSMQNLRGVGPEKLKDWQLFKNIAGVIMPLNQLLDSKLATEEWLSEYLIDDTENCFQEIRDEKFLINHQTIYPNIIVRFWNDIIENDFFSEQNIKEFYESIVAYFELSESLIQLNNVPYIFTGSEFLSSNDIFYHVEFDQSADYQNMRRAIKELTGYDTPVKAILSFLDTKPFVTKSNSLKDNIQSADLSEEEALAIFHFSQLAKLNLFDYGYFSNESENIRFEPSTDCKQFYSDKPDVIEYIESYCNYTLVPLPSALSGYKDLVIKGEKLYKEIIDNSVESWKNSDEVLILLLNLLSDSGLKDICKSLVNSIDSIQLSSKACNDDGITFVWVKLLNSIFETHEFDSIKNKVSIDGVSLSELSWNNVISLEGEDQIELGNILSRFKDTKAVSVIREQLLKSKKFDANKINALFQSDTIPADSELAEIADEMLIEESNQLINSDQLQLVIYLFRNKKLKSIDKIKVLAEDGNWYSLADTWYLKSHDFIDDDAILDSSYEGIGRKSFGEYSIISKPFFHRERNTFICPHLKEPLQGDTLIHFLELVKEQIIKNAQSNVNWLDGFTSNIGFNPKYSVFAEQRFIHSGEELPETVVDWAKRSNENSKFLTSIGVNGEESATVKLRQYLLKEIDDYSFEGYSRSSERDKFLLKNSLDVMSEAGIEFDDEFGAIIKSITEFISPVFDISDIQLPVSVRVVGNRLYYMLKDVGTAYLLSPEFIGDCIRFIGKDYTPFFQSLVDAGITIVDPDCLSDEWKRKYTKLLQFNDAEIDIDILESDSRPCDLPQYLSWKDNTDSEISISFTENSIPHITSLKYFEDEVSIQFSSGDFYYDNESQVLYTKKDTYNEAVIKELKDLIDSDELTALIGGGGVVVHSARESELLLKIQKLEEKLNAISLGEDIERGGLGKDPQKDWNLEARNMLRNHLNNVDGFDCSGWDDSNIPSSVVRGVKFQGKACTWIVRSAMSNKSQFHLTPYEWTLLEQKHVFLALRTSQHDIRIYGIDEDIRKVIFENNHTININFDSELLTFEGIDGFAKLLVQFNVWGSGLVFKNPEYSAGNSFKDLEKCKEGIVNKLSDDVL